MKYIVKAHINEQLAKDYLKRHEGISSTLWKKIKREDNFWLNGIKVRASQAKVKLMILSNIISPLLPM